MSLLTLKIGGTKRLVKFSPPGKMTVTIGGRKYPIVQIGNQLWLAENLDFKFTGLVVGAGGTSSDPQANYYNNDESTYGVNGNKYGLLYNWYAVKYLEDNKSSLLPAGWHVPTKSEWETLAAAVGSAPTDGTKLKSTTGWSSGAGTDDYGFSAFPAGYYSGNSSKFGGLGTDGNFFTATENGMYAYYREVSTDAEFHSGQTYKYDKLSVRLVKDVQ